MAINAIEAAALFQTNLDLLAVREATTGWMDANAGQVLYNGGAEVKIPKISVQGLGDYDRDTGYVQGSISLGYETRKMTQDRGRKFQLDAMDVNESNFVATASTAMAEFQRVYVIPEIDAYRIAKLAAEAISAKAEGMVEYGYTPGAAGTSALKTFLTAAKKVKEHYNGPMTCQASSDFVLALEIELADKLRTVTVERNGITLTVPQINGIPIIETPADRMYTAITTKDGKTSGQEAGGYVKAENALTVNFILCPTTAPIAVNKQDKMKIFTPDQNQDADAWKMNYRRYHDLWVKDNAAALVYVSIKEAEGSTASEEVPTA